MKTITPTIQKGGTGKSAIACQLAYYISQRVGLRTLLIDLDHQGNSTRALRTGGLATVPEIPSSTLMTSRVTNVPTDSLVLVPADGDGLRLLEQKPESHNEFATNLKAFIHSMRDQFDVCVIDTNPNPDIRQLAALVVSDFVVAPVQLTQESIDGISDMLNHPAIGIRKIQATINPTLQLLGLLPNLVEATPFQQENLKALVSHYRDLLIPLHGSVAAIKKSTAVYEAQSAGLPIWTLGKTSSRNAWQNIEPVFAQILQMMEPQA